MNYHVLLKIAALSLVQGIVLPAFAAGGIPVETIMQRPKYSQVSLSPDGKLLGAVVPLNERRNLAIIDLEKRTVVPLTNLKETDVASYDWIGDRMIEISVANLADASGNIELKQRVLIDTDGRVVRDMFRASLRENAMRDTVYLGTNAFLRIVEVLDRAGDDLIVESNERGRYALDAYRYNPRTAAKTLLTFDSPGDVSDFTADHAGQVRVAVTSPRGGEKTALWYRKSNDDQWIKLRESAVEEDTIRPIAFDYDGKTLYVRARTEANGGRLGVYAFDPENNQLGALLFESQTVDAGRLIFDRVKQKPIGISGGSLDGIKWIDPQWDRLQKAIDAALPKTRNFLSWGQFATDRVVVTSTSDVQPPVFYLLDRKTMRMEEVASSYPAIDTELLSPRKFVRYKARDGIDIPAYLTIPKSSNGKNLPLVVDIHGGPYVPSTRYGFNAEAQFFASRGYAVLQPDFRGTQGYGDAFYKAGWKQWGLAMQDDVTDGVKWLIANGTVDKDRVCLFGGSYGGYATLWGLEKEPQMFRCGVAYVAVSDLELMFDVTWSDFMRAERGGDTTKVLTRWIGDPDKDREKMRAVSPIFHADRIAAPLLLAYGAADVRVPLIHGSRMRSALDKYNKPYEWVVYPEEGHGFNKDENRFDFYHRVEAFLDKNLAPR